MTVNLWPADAVAGAPLYTGVLLRQLVGGVIGGKTSTRPLGGRTGVWPGTPSTTVSVSGATITIATHAGVMDLETPANAGPYNYTVDPAETKTLTAASSTDQRVDSIFMQMSDPAEGDGSSNPGAAVVYQTGTVGPAGGARGSAGGPPNVPARAFELAQIVVPKSGTGSPAVTWVAPCAVAAGGILPTSGSTQYPFGAYVGQYIDDVTLGLLRWSGSGWSSFGLGGDTGWTAVPHGGSYASGSSPEQAEMRVLNGVGYMHGLLQLAAGGNFATSSTIVLTAAGSIPAAYRPAKRLNVPLASSTPANAVRGILDTDGSLTIVTGASAGAYVDLGGFNGYPVV